MTSNYAYRDDNLPPPYDQSNRAPYPETYGGGYPQPGEQEPGFGKFSAKFSEKSIRMGFIRKVYITLMIQLLITFGFVAVFVLVEPVNHWVRANRWFFYISFAVFLVTYMLLACLRECRRRAPGNYICLTIFTLSMSYMIGATGAYFKAEATLVAVGIAIALCAAITIFAWQTRIDFTVCSSLIFALSIILMLTGLSCLIIYLIIGPSRVLQGVYGGIVMVVFGLYLVYDTQYIMGGRHYELDPEEYIYGALQLYVDVAVIMMALIGIVGSTQ